MSLVLWSVSIIANPREKQVRYCTCGITMLYVLNLARSMAPITMYSTSEKETPDSPISTTLVLIGVVPSQVLDFTHP